MTNNLTVLYNDFRTDFENSPDFVIDFYTKSSVFFNNIKAFKDEHDLRYFIEMTCKYVEAVYQKDRYNQALDLIDKYLPFIDNEISRLNADELKDGWYQSFHFVKAMSLYKLKDYSRATPIFKTLTNIDPENDNYKSWLRYSVYGQRLWLTYLINVVAGLFIVSDIFFESYISNYYVQQSLLGIGLLLLIGSGLYEYFIKRSFRRTDTNK
jgi:tetratricopeptide (TPR) repeat protein